MARRADPDALFVSEADLARRHGLSAPEWVALAIVLERDGFPRRDPLTGLRYTRAVEAFWNRRYGLSSIEPSKPDGMENLDAL
jgi:hypothetical protein